MNRMYYVADHARKRGGAGEEVVLLKKEPKKTAFLGTKRKYLKLQWRLLV